MLVMGCTFAQAVEFPYAKQVLPPLNLARGGATTTLNLTGLFGVNNVNGPLVQFTYTGFVMFLELYPDIAPLTVTNFRTYLTEGAYDESYIHRAEAGFVIQGGGYHYGANVDLFAHIPTHPPVMNEFKLSNLPGTIAMAKLPGDLNSATSEWYLNLANNSYLDAPDQKFTVFGRLLFDGLEIAQAISQLPTTNYNAESDPDGPFSKVPYITSGGVDYFVSLEKAQEIPLLRLLPANPGFLTITTTSSNPAAVLAEVTASGLKLTTASIGTSVIMVRATDPAGNWVETGFLATSVDTRLPVISIRATIPTTREGSLPAGKFRISRTGPLSKALNVRLDASGSTATNGIDLASLSGVVRIPAGKSFVDVAVASKRDTAKEGTENMTLNILSTTTYTVAPVRSASVDILDANVPTVTMTVIDGIFTENSTDTAMVQFTRTGPTTASLPLFVTAGGAAQLGVDYQISPADLSIPAGQASVISTFAAVLDLVKESDEPVILTPTASATYNLPKPVSLKLQDAP